MHMVTEEVHGYEIWRAQDRTGRQYTVKKYLIMEAASRALFVAEMEGVIDCQPEQSVLFLDAFLDGVKVSIVFDNEYGVYVREALQERGPAPEMVASIVLRQVLQILCYLHEECSRLHNDIDARNILCLSTGQVRLGGFCHSFKNLGRSAKFTGPYVHMAPERLLGIECSFPSDIWSLGVLAKELALGKGPYAHLNLDDPTALFEFKQTIVAQPIPSLKGVESCTDEMRSFVDICLQKNIRARWTAAELLKHPLIRRYEGFLLPAGSWFCRSVKPSPLILTATAHQPHPVGKGPGQEAGGGKATGPAKDAVKRPRALLKSPEALSDRNA